MFKDIVYLNLFVKKRFISKKHSTTLFSEFLVGQVLAHWLAPVRDSGAVGRIDNTAAPKSYIFFNHKHILNKHILVGKSWKTIIQL